MAKITGFCSILDDGESRRRETLETRLLKDYRQNNV